MLPVEYRTNRHFIIIPINTSMSKNEPSYNANHIQIRMDFTGKLGDHTTDVVGGSGPGWNAITCDAFLIGMKTIIDGERVEY